MLPLNHGLCCPESCQLLVSGSGHGVTGRVRNEMHLSSLVLKVSGGQDFQLEDGRLAERLAVEKGQREWASFLLCCFNHFSGQPVPGFHHTPYKKFFSLHLV